ncbi:MAG: DUF192 domain-containing protein [Woeseiaceae bacterium]
MKFIAKMWLVVLLSGCMSLAADELDDAFDRDVLVIVGSSHTCYLFDIYLAVTTVQTRRGLMHVRKMPETTGMLFVYEEDDYHSMYMKNTLIPLDMLYIRADGTIATIHTNTEPHSLESRGPVEPVRYVLELNGGVTEKYRIDLNSRVLWRGMR